MSLEKKADVSKARWFVASEHEKKADRIVVPLNIPSQSQNWSECSLGGDVYGIDNREYKF